MSHPITLADAVLRVDFSVHELLAGALPPYAELEKIAEQTSPCDDPDDDGPAGRVVASVEYQVLGVLPDDFPRCFEAMHAWWTDHGFRELHDARPGGLYVWVENNHDGFRMAAQANDLGELYLTASSPCVWPEGQDGRR